MNELALFAGAGGGILGGVLLGWRTVCAVEIDPYARRVLLARQNDGCLQAFPVFDDVRAFDGRPWRGRVDVVSGGFPCQDISCAGKGAGITGERSGLWKEMARIIGEVRPRFAFIENSPMLVIRGLETVLCDLAAMGFDARWGIVSAADTGAPHLRKRIWILADSGCRRCDGSRQGEDQFTRGNEAIRTSESMAYTEINGRFSRRAGNCDEVSQRRESDRGGCDVLLSDPESERRREAGGFRLDESTQRTAGICERERERETNRLPTPKSRDWRIEKMGENSRNSLDLNRVAGGSLNPLWVEWLMGWPLGWTDLSASATDRFQRWLHSHGACYQGETDELPRIEE